MDCVYELIKKSCVGRLEIIDSLGLFSTKEKAIKSKHHLERYNPNEKYNILYRRVD